MFKKPVPCPFVSTICYDDVDGFPQVCRVHSQTDESLREESEIQTEEIVISGGIIVDVSYGEIAK